MLPASAVWRCAAPAAARSSPSWVVSKRFKRGVLSCRRGHRPGCPVLEAARAVWLPPAPAAHVARPVRLLAPGALPVAMRGRPGLPVSVRVIRVGAKRRRIARSLPAQHALAAADAIVAVDDGRVAARSAVDEVARAVDRRQPVDAGTAEQPIGVQAAGEAVVAGAAAQDVAPAAA